MENKTLKETIDERIKNVDEEFRNILKNSYCTGYSFYDTNIQKNTEINLEVINMAISILFKGEEILISANVKYNQFFCKSSSKIKDKFKITYSF